MIWAPVLAISLGAAAGALLRWQLGVQLNSLFPTLPPGTLAANLIGDAFHPEWNYSIRPGPKPPA